MRIAYFDAVVNHAWKAHVATPELNVRQPGKAIAFSNHLGLPVGGVQA
jgi:hypothetical protein